MRIGLAIAITLVCMLMMATGTRFTYSAESGIMDFALYHFSHANWWHMAVNMCGLWSFRPRVSTCAVSFIIASLAAMADAATFDAATCGLSAFLCAAYARSYVAWKHDIWVTVTILLCMAAIPNINWHVHLIAFLISYVTWMIIYYIKGK